MRRIVMAVVLIGTLVAACSDDGGTASTTTAPPPELLVTGGVLGEYLSDSLGRTVYVTLADDRGISTCTGACAETWPPVPGPMNARSGVGTPLLGTVSRDDGTVQVTYNGYPLYYYAGDDQAGEFTGQGVGDTWYVISPEGDPILPPEPDA